MQVVLKPMMRVVHRLVRSALFQMSHVGGVERLLLQRERREGTLNQLINLGPFRLQVSPNPHMHRKPLLVPTSLHGNRAVHENLVLACNSLLS